MRYASSYGAAQQHESTSISLALLLATEKLKVIAAIHPGIWHPAVLAKFINTADQFSHGRAAVNVVSGWFKDEYTDLGLEWLEHDERYERAAEFIQVLRGLWTQEKFSFHGKYYDITDFTLRPFPYEVPGRAHPDIFQGGNSTAARFNGGAYSDWYFSNGKDFDGFTEQYDDVTRIAAEHGRRTLFGLNGFVIQRDSRARRRSSSCARSSRTPTTAPSRASVRACRSGNATKDKKGMWADSSVEDLVQYNDGFRTQLFGDAQQIASGSSSTRSAASTCSFSGSCTSRRARAVRRNGHPDRARTRGRPRAHRRPDRRRRPLTRVQCPRHADAASARPRVLETEAADRRPRASMPRQA